MAITDIQISEELETNAPSIKYRGNEGPKSPQEEQMMMADAILEEEYNKYVFDLLEIRPEATPMTLEEFRQMVIAEGQMSKGPILPSPEDPVNPFQPKPQGPVLPDRQMAAYGGIMGLDGRKQYGIGSWFQENIMDPIKENPLVAAAAAAAGYDYFGRGDDSLIRKALGSDTLQNVLKGSRVPKKDSAGNVISKDGEIVYTDERKGGVYDALAKNIVPIVGGLGAGLFTKGQPGGGQDASTYGVPSDNTAMNIQEYTKGLNLLDEKGMIAAGQNFALPDAARKYSPEEMIAVYQNAANGGRIGFAGGGGFGPEGWSGIERAKRVWNSMSDDIQNKYNGFNDFFMGGEWININMANGGRIGFSEGTNLRNRMSALMNKMASGTITPEEMIELRNMESASMFSKAKGMAEGGLMDLGGMEKDYRAEGGFVPIGKQEKADDVPARLSVNEFVFTADAVRNAGGGDIDQGAEVMENMMKHLEAGGQVSEESQGMAGARDMFATSQRLGDVV
jgi:hypothetical protein